jgi:DNA-binding response OmpR family regulator
MSRVLLINDEPDLLEMCELVLESAGHTAVLAFAGQDGVDLDSVVDPAPDVVVLDLVMPHVTGAEVYQRLRESGPTSQTPVVIMSALPNTVEIAEELGAQAYLEKPFDPDALLAAVDQALAAAGDRKPR